MMQAAAEKAVVILDNGDDLHGLTSVSASAKANGQTTGAIEFVMLPTLRGHRTDQA